MRIQASVQICNRDLPSHNKAQRRKEDSCLTIGTIGKSQVSILHQTAKDNAGVRYKILGNLARVHNQFMKDGKASLSFKSPPIDLLIETDADQLTKFLKIIHSVVSGKNISELKLTNLASSTKFTPKPKNKLVVNAPSELPTQGYPRSLQYLTINKCGFSKLDRGILRLQCLIELNLCDNKITNLPEQIDLLPSLRVLRLSNNCLGANNWNWLNGKSLQQNLIHLDLSNNSIKFVPRNLEKLKCLRHLDLKCNQIKILTNSLLQLHQLKHLDVQSNELRFIPYGFKNLHLSHFNISGNEELFKRTHIMKNYTPRMLSLKEFSARAVHKARATYNDKTVPRELVHYLDNGSSCICRKLTFPDFSDIGLVISVPTYKFLSNLEASGFFVNVNFHPCSSVCYNNVLNVI